MQSDKPSVFERREDRAQSDCRGDPIFVQISCAFSLSFCAVVSV